jgi:WD40 repeat protein
MTSEAIRLAIRSEPDVEITLYDAAGGRLPVREQVPDPRGDGDQEASEDQEAGTGAVVAAVRPGLYRVHLDRCGFVCEHLIQHDSPKERFFEGPRVESPAPVDIAHPRADLARLARDLAETDQESARSIGTGDHDGRLVIVIYRGQAPPVASLVSEPVSIHDLTGRELVKLGADPTGHDSEPGARHLALSYRVVPGAYRLRVGNAARDLVVAIPRGRAAQVFLADHGNVSLGTARVYLPRLDDGLDLDIARAMESVLWALRLPRGDLPRIAAALLPVADRDLSFAMACAHLMQRTLDRGADRLEELARQGDQGRAERDALTRRLELVRKALDGVLRVLAEHADALPDAAILAAVRGPRADAAPGSPRLATPPLYRASLTLALEHGLEIDPRSAFMETVKAGYDDAVWCTWGPGLWHQLWIDPTIERLRSPAPADPLGSARHAGPPAGVDEIVRATRLPPSVVALAFRRLDAGLPRIDGAPSALAIPGYAIGEITRRDERSVTALASYDAQVAIQIIPAASRDALDRVSSAILAVRRLEHRQLLRIARHGVLADGSGAWVETEPCKASLFEHMAAVGGPLPHAQACELILPALGALEYVHGQLAVHGDIHPGNLLIRSGGSAVLGLPRLASREAADEPAATDLDGPWLHFVAPECLVDPAAVSPASDVWSMAATLYFALTLELPRERYTGQDELEAARGNPVIPIRERLPGVPDLLASCLDRALSSRPDARFRDGKQFHGELVRSMRASEFAAQATALHDELVRADPACASTIRNIFVRITVLIDGEVGWRRVARDLLRYRDGAENRRVDEVLRRFHAAGLIRMGSERIPGGEPQAFVEPAFDELISSWSQIRSWIDDLDTMPGGRILVADLELAARWWSAHRSDSLLWRDGREKRADAIRRGHRYTFNAEEEEFIERSLHRRRIRWLVRAAAVAALVVVSGCVYWQREIAATARTDAQVLARALQETGRERVLDGHPFQALPYLVAAGKAETGPALRMLFHTASRRLLPAPSLDHSDAVRRVAFSPDGKRVVTASTDGTACIWDAATGLRIACFGHKGAVVGAAFSPDGTWIVTASEDWTAEVWDAATGKPLVPPLQHERIVQTAAFSPDGAHVVTASLDHTARVWNSRTGVMEHKLEHRDAVWSAVFSSDGTRIVTASRDRTARIWDAATGKPVGVPMEHRDAVWGAAFSPDGSPDGVRVVTASQDGTARIWDAATGEAIRVPDQVTHSSNPLVLHHGDGVTSASFDPSGRYVVTTSHDSTARVWSAVDGSPVTPWLEHRGSVSAAAFSADGARVVTASEDDVARIWDARTGGLLPPILEHTGPVSSAVFSPDGTRVVTASFDRTARIWNATDDRPPVALGFDGEVRGAMFNPDATRIVTVSEGGEARIWGTIDGRSAGRPLVYPEAVRTAVRTAAYSPDGRQIVTTSDDRSVRVWDAATGALAMPPLAARGTPSSATFSPDGTRIIAAGGDQDTSLQDSLQIWRADGRAEIPLRLEYPERVMRARLSGDNLRLITANATGTARVWDAVTGKAITPRLEHPGGVTSVAFNRDATRALTTGQDGTARIWDADHGNLTVAPLAQPRVGILTAAFSPDGTRIVTVNDDRSVRVWDASTGKPLTPPLRHDTAVINAAFSPDGEQLISVDSRVVRTWDVGLDHRSLRDWANVASQSPYVLEDGVLTPRSFASPTPASPARVRLPSS